MSARNLTLLLVLLTTACSSADSNSEPTLPAAGAAPLGAGYPDPDALLSRILYELEKRNFDAACACLAGPGLSGRPVPLVPGENLPRIPPGRSDLWPPLEDLKGLRQFLRQPWKQIRYGRPRNLSNDPPFIAVTVKVDYAWERIPEGERKRIVSAQKELRKRPVTWEDVVRDGQVREQAEASGSRPLPTLRFAWLRNTWRLYIGP